MSGELLEQIRKTEAASHALQRRLAWELAACTAAAENLHEQAAASECIITSHREELASRRAAHMTRVRDLTAERDTLTLQLDVQRRQYVQAMRDLGQENARLREGVAMCQAALNNIPRGGEDEEDEEDEEDIKDREDGEGDDICSGGKDYVSFCGDKSGQGKAKHADALSLSGLLAEARFQQDRRERDEMAYQEQAQEQQVQLRDKVAQLEASAEAHMSVFAQQAREQGRGAALLEAQQRTICHLEEKLARALDHDTHACANSTCLISAFYVSIPAAADANAGQCSVGACPTGGCCHPAHML